MNGIASIVPAVLDLLEHSGNYTGTELRSAFSSVPFPAAPEKVTLIVGLGAAAVSGLSVGARLDGSRMGKRLKASVKIQIISPLVLGAEQCTSVLNDLCGDLLFDSSLGAVNLTAGEVKCNTQRRAYEMTAVLVVDTLYYQP